MEKFETGQASIAPYPRGVLAELEARLDRAEKHNAKLRKELQIERTERERLSLECQRMNQSRSWRLTAPLRHLCEIGRRLTLPRARCGALSRLVMLVVLFPVLPCYYKGLYPAFKSLRRGKAAFGEVLDRAQNLWTDDIPTGLTDRLCHLLLAFALRIRRNGGVIPALAKSRQALHKHGRRGLFLLAEPLDANHESKRQSRLMDVLTFFADDENGASSEKSICPDVTVVVPVYNGLVHLERLCPALFAHSPATARFVFVDDASPDPAVAVFLQQHIASRPDCVLLRNEKNLGFVKTVNRGMEKVQTPYAVWLNTDVVVPQEWLPRLLAPLTRKDKIASTTPFTNSAVYFSYPVRGTDNPIPRGTTPKELDRAFARLSPQITARCDIHSGVGFCMGINMDCWKAIGPLDAEAFDRGYGEECDWCMRASSRGWRNVLAPNLFVYHAHGGSFATEEKMALIDAHMKVLWQRWPAQMASVAEHEQKDPWEPYRAMAALLLARHTGDAGQAAEGQGRTVLMVDLALNTGGACAYREKVIGEFEERGDRILLLQYTVRDCRWTLHPRYLGSESLMHLDTPEEVRELFEILPLDAIFINNLAFCEKAESMLQLLASLKKQHVHVVYAFHDFFSVCPSFFLLDNQNTFCHGGNPEKCIACLDNNHNCTVFRSDVTRWRAMWGPFLAQCDELRFFSETTRKIASSIYPDVARGVVIEHAPLEPFDGAFTLADKEEPLVIGFLGPFVLQKGSEFLQEIALDLKAEHPGSRLITFGESYGVEGGPAGIQHTGPYKRADLPELLTQHGVKVVVFPSPWPETFSYVAQECVMLGVPFVCFDIGAPAERIRKNGYPRCAIAPEFTAKSMLQTAQTLLDRVYAEQSKNGSSD